MEKQAQWVKIEANSFKKIPSKGKIFIWTHKLERRQCWESNLSDPPVSSVTKWLSNQLHSLPNESKNSLLHKNCSWIFTSLIFIIPRSWQQPVYPQGVHPQGYIHTVEYCKTTWKTEVLIYTTWMDLEIFSMMTSIISWM